MSRWHRAIGPPGAMSEPKNFMVLKSSIFSDEWWVMVGWMLNLGLYNLWAIHIWPKEMKMSSLPNQSMVQKTFPLSNLLLSPICYKQLIHQLVYYKKTTGSTYKFSILCSNSYYCNHQVHCQQTITAVSIKTTTAYLVFRNLLAILQQR